MPWKVREVMSLRKEFIQLAMQPDSNIRELCRRFGIGPKTGYKWLGRFAGQGDAGLRDRSRRPHKSPARTPSAQEAVVVAMRDRHRAWGGRKIRARMLALGHQAVPAASTVTGILRRHGRLDEAESDKHKAWIRFEHEAPNDLWQMDFKGHFPMAQGRCHPLTVLDDHSRFSVGLFACSDERTLSVQARLSGLFRHYGMPKRILADNGSPWGSSPENRYTQLGVWLLRLGIGLSHGRPYHPQTQGKEERFHRTLNAELLRWEQFQDLAHCQIRFDDWRDVYNQERPHEALDMAVPASRYRMSGRSFPEILPPIEYGLGDEVRKVDTKGTLRYKGARYNISLAFQGYPVAIRPTSTDGLMNVVFCQHTIAQIDLKSRTGVRI